ncbi:cholinesterase-like [Oppia nitens]|uniref:cholinesterase-like n=1 Tax=Oppia nitens TaxID=1686743 RepID=UPI0023DA90C9|nr:cholinesterase-like [Oppia nitens]
MKESRVLMNWSIEINTTSGVVRGQTIHVLNRQINQFLGIPFAEPPIGSLRFAKPKAIQLSAPDIIDATKSKSSCWQPLANLKLSEDCLYVNIWSPNRVNHSMPNIPKAVMFFIHGGGLQTGSIFLLSFYNGSILATNDVVVVTTNYRLGPFGFLYGADESAPGNVGFYDQLLALKWVRDNIEAFGGDPNQVTIFGESAGSWSVSAHILSPLSRGLFHRAIMQSGSVMFYKDRYPINKTDALNNAKQMARSLNCTETHWLQCLRTVEPKQLVQLEKTVTFPLIGTDFLPVSTQKAFQTHAVNTDIDLIAGIVHDEGSLADSILLVSMDNMTIAKFVDYVNKSDQQFHGMNAQKIADYYLKSVDKTNATAIRLAFNDFFGDLLNKCPTYLFARQLAEIKSMANKNVYFYELTYLAEKFGKYLGCDTHVKGICHGADIPYVFGLPFSSPLLFEPIDQTFSATVMKQWTNFVKFGNPDNLWPQMLNTTKVLVRELNPKNKILENIFQQTCDTFWKNYFI